MSMRSIRRRSRASIALAVSVPLIAGFGLMSAGFAGISSASGATSVVTPSEGAPPGPQRVLDASVLQGSATDW
ncbi:hypothetical protein [Brachybacterium phenoliresistens]|uniref:Uncharacterized protein n=1 Tax=Brachybacterium phenoliresistens TaxID=396014 RepID=Z9JPN5_9MICO|nr:hypothetical protein [Brachybacterium phenoliresistens]EWS79761.1 hypothetical protein BF93_09775 [Brachybacterium phenoliresistens]